MPAVAVAPEPEDLGSARWPAWAVEGQMAQLHEEPYLVRQVRERERFEALTASARRRNEPAAPRRA